MRLLFLLLLIAFIIGACKNPTHDKYHILIPGVGFDNIRVGETTFDNIIQIYGNNYRTDTFYLKPINYPVYLDSNTIEKKVIYSIKVAYDSLGLGFYFYPHDTSIFLVSFALPFKGKTEKGIVLGESTFNDIIKVYGDSAWSFTKKSVMLTYNGIWFYQDLKNKLTTDKESLTSYIINIDKEDSIQYLNNKVKEIDIVQPTKQAK